MKAQDEDRPPRRARRPDPAPTPDILPLGQSRSAQPGQCPGCGHSNARERRFCAECGVPLYQPCLGCGAIAGAWERFCGACGLDLTAALEERTREVFAKHHQAQLLREEGRYAEAVALLEEMAELDHPLLGEFRSRALGLLPTVRTERNEAEARQSEVYNDAQRAFDDNDYERAAKLLEPLPEGLRSGPVQVLLDAALAHQREVARLVSEIRAGLASNQYAGLRAKAERLLELKPQYEQARGLAERLRQFDHRQQHVEGDRLMKLALVRLAAREYDEAVSLLEQVPEAARTDEVRRRLHATRELAWLVRRLRDAVVLDATLVGVARRLAKLKPEDEKARRFADELQRRYEKQGTPAALLRSAKPQEAHFRCPIELAHGFRHLAADAIRSMPAFVKHPGGFYVACGLALEGLRQSAIQVNLAPPASEGVLARLTRAVRKRQPTSAWGIELGYSALKALKLRLAADGTGVVAEACEHIEYDNPRGQPGVGPPPAAKKAVQIFLQRHNPADDLVCVSFPGHALLARSFKAPLADSAKLADLVRYEAVQQIPFPLEHVVWGYQALGGDEAPLVHEREILLFAVKRHLLSAVEAPLAELGIRPDVIQSDLAALYNYLANDGWIAGDSGAPGPHANEPQEAVLALDVGADSTKVVIAAGHSLWLRSMPVAGNDFTKALVSGMKLTFADAERRKRDPTAASSAMYQIYEALEPAFQQFVTELERSINYCANSRPRWRIGKMLGLGGGFRLHGLVERLLRGEP